MRAVDAGAASGKEPAVVDGTGVEAAGEEVAAEAEEQRGEPEVERGELGRVAILGVTELPERGAQAGQVVVGRTKALVAASADRVDRGRPAGSAASECREPGRPLPLGDLPFDSTLDRPVEPAVTPGRGRARGCRETTSRETQPRAHEFPRW